MPKDLGSWNLEKIASRIFVRRYLLELQLSDGTVRLTNWNALEYEGHTWFSSRFRFARTGGDGVSIQLTDQDDYLFETLIQSRSTKLGRGILSMLLGDEASVADGSHDVIFSGVISDVTSRSQDISMNLILPPKKRVPNRYCDVTAGMNHLPDSPLTVELGGTSYNIS